MDGTGEQEFAGLNFIFTSCDDFGQVVHTHASTRSVIS